MNDSNDSDAIAELLTLIMEVDQWGSTYRNPMGQLHREHGPAVDDADGSKYWYLDGQRHRVDGPAIEWANGNKLWYLNDEYITEEEFHDRTK